ncbi:MAG: 6-phosphogluconolactonase [Meiothermus sp.]|uniref:6-phosphogluconolactonase n=1 Tax=Meiothermus sp. TaxID=1955249 RepID=UPI0025E02AB6|nr:6-phosphogluconolactonase [Meiothermus sp.]MCS7069286.1 6-phosphogluconolactonase [Meiothermus sp.]MDW8426168.1 6-phosphogluconolactonase [Meiothermus sp.]
MPFAVEIFPQPEAVARALAGVLALGLKEGGRAVLAGGRTPLPAYRLLAREALPWEQVEFIPSDERCVEPDSPERNDLLIQKALGSRARLWRFPAELGPTEAAERMEEVVARKIPFAIVVLGLGEDGHTASLFPGHRLDHETWVAPVFEAPKPPPQRVTLTPKALAQTDLLLLVATGRAKRGALARLLEGEALPPNLIPAPRRLVLCDEAAYPYSSSAER